MTANRPLVSIGLPTYNRVASVSRTIDSALDQTYAHFELIISDNGSTDDTATVCKDYVRKDVRVRYVRHAENKGWVNNFYYLLQQARGDYFAWLADDEWWDPRYIETLVEALEKHKEYNVAQSSFQFIGADGSHSTKVIWDKELDLTHQSYYAVYKKIFMATRILYYIYGLFRRRFLLQVLERPLQECLSWDRIIISEISLATHFYSVKPVFLFFSTQSTSSFERVFPRVRLSVLLKAFYRAMTSPVIPFQRKLYVVKPWLQVLWFQRAMFYTTDRTKYFSPYYWKSVLGRKYKR